MLLIRRVECLEKSFSIIRRCKLNHSCGAQWVGYKEATQGGTDNS